nr:MAG TPA: Tor inhibition protein helix, reverse turn, PROTEIN [Caudoviricetes sp.]
MTPLLPITDPITTKQACELLKCNAVTLWRYARDGKFKKYALTRKNVLYSLSEITAFINSSVVLDGKSV